LLFKIEFGQQTGWQEGDGLIIRVVSYAPHAQNLDYIFSLNVASPRDESRMGKSRTDRYRITDFVSFVPIDFESDVKNENGTKTGYTKR
jgi:hypothetical protein